MAKKKTAVAEAKETAVKETAKAAPAKETAKAAVKEEVKETAKPAAKETAKAAPAAKAKAKTKAEAKVSVKIQFGGNEYDVEDIKKAVEEDAKSKFDVAAETVEIYVKPEDGAAYYVVNSELSDKVEL